MEYLLRDDSPFSEEQWGKIDELVVKVATQQLVGRRILPVYGPLGAGIQSINLDTVSYKEEGEMDLFGDSDTCEISADKRRFVAIPMIYKDLSISWRDVETSKRLRTPLDLSTVAAAAAACSKKEDYLIFNGSNKFGYPGLLTVEGRQVVDKSDWREDENPFNDVAKGIEKLIEEGVYGPYGLVTSPDLYVQMQRLQESTGLLEFTRVKELVDGNVFQSPVLPENTAVLVAIGPQNMDLVIGQDMITGYIGPEQLNHKMRVLETLVLRIKRPEAIVTFE
ncbi:family 1 encapsulin nanocompartment shell protein [Alkaliphilus transvaalensis]|uniref:family 1 encapsulin nanocompartment shell protein n=1 Tax=Alkaliphilus transvaalensis TaxID=114628 RepID=UPI00047CB183|nr:family 1 encapsulin nanocompartment shell protein [Alkaliphilus transvaalensis]